MADINELGAGHIKKILDEKISIFFTSCGIAWRRVENPYFIDLVDTLISLRPEKLEYTPPNRQTLASSALKSTHAVFDKVKKKLLQKTNSILMGDAWKNTSNGQKYLVFTLRNINVDQVFLTFRNISAFKEFAENLAEWINDAIKLAYNQYGTNVVGVITDNDAKIKAGGKIAQNFFGEQLLTSICFSHSGNLLVKDLVDEPLAKQLRQVISAFDGPKMNYLVTKLFGGFKMQNFPDTRFCFMRNTCETILKNVDGEVLQQVACSLADTDDSIEDSTQQLILDESFRTKLKTTIDLLTPICKLINACQDPKKNIADGTEMWLTLKLNSSEHEETLQKRIDKAIPDLGYASNLVHPKYKGLNLDDDQKAAAMLFFEQNLDAEGFRELQNFLSTRDQDDNDYIAKNCSENALPYWGIQEDIFPKLAKLCLKIFLFPASTAMLEGFFSIWTYLHNRYRNKLRDDNSALLADTYHMSLHLQTGKWKNTVNKRKYINGVGDSEDDSDYNELLNDADDDAFEDEEAVDEDIV